MPNEGESKSETPTPSLPIGDKCKDCGRPASESACACKVFDIWGYPKQQEDDTSWAGSMGGKRVIVGI